ncbi:MAG: FAD-dependent oxidoreductase [Thermoplasmata archaeon]
MQVLPPTRGSYSFPFLDSRVETPTSMTFRFSTRGSGFTFQSNQAVRLQIPGIQDPWGPARLLSLSSSPTETDWIAVTVKMTGSPFKEALRNVKPGDRVQVFGPLGDLIYVPTRPAVMIAGGIGITPFRGMTRFAVDRGVDQPITLLYSARVPEEFAFRTELDEMAQRHPKLRIVYTVTRPQEATVPWKGRVGRIDERLIREAAADLDAPNFYFAGLPEMIESTMEILRSRLGIPEERLWWEPFRGY